MKLDFAKGNTVMDVERTGYRLLCSLYDPSESTEPEPDQYMTEVPSFPNCVAWGEMVEEMLSILESVVVETIQTYQEQGYELLPGLFRQIGRIEG